MERKQSLDEKSCEVCCGTTGGVGEKIIAGNSDGEHQEVDCTMGWREKAENSEGNRCGIQDGDLPDIGGGGVILMTAFRWRKQRGKSAGGG